MTSIRSALRRRLVIGLCVLFGIVGGGLYFAIRAMLIAQFDHGLLGRARLLASLVKHETHGELEVEISDEPGKLPEFERRDAPEYFELWRAGASVLARSPSLKDGDLPRPEIPGGKDRAFFDLRLPDGRPGRAVLYRFVPRTGPPVVEEGSAAPPPAPLTQGVPPAPTLLLVTTLERSSLDETLAGVGTALAAAWILLLVGAALIVTGSVGRGLRPLDDVAHQASRIDVQSLAYRFPVEGMPQELLSICQRLNDLLARLEDSFRRERRFTSDVAHELRTPLSELRASAEVALRWPDGPQAAQTLQDVLDASLAMERIVNNLLALARCDAGRQEVTIERIDVARAMEEAWRPFKEQAAARHLSVSLAPGSAAIDTDRTLLAAILTNLFSNAVEYSDEGGSISCALGQVDGVTALDIANTTSLVSAADLPSLFDPFWRKEAARSDRVHSGLGLTLVSAFARLAGIQVAADLPEAGRFRIRLRFAPA